MKRIGIILGRGFSTEINLKDEKSHFINTPYGKPSENIKSGLLYDKEVLLLRRNGEDGQIPAFKVNYKANIIAMYELGCDIIMATSICSSLQEEITVGEFVVFNQFIDFTRHQELTFSDKIPDEKLNHTSMHKPFSDDIRNYMIESAVMQGITIHTKGSVLAVDGPRQSTRAESNLYRQFGADVINNSTVPEAILSHELNLPYGVISLCTHFDSWRTDIQPVTFADKNQVMEENAEKLGKLFLKAVENAE
ncbi:MAG: MTAP family purine nucleoside phosphorylase [Bacteroidales bacterium]|nr:MTAP family purine nucleoside phosphorylase [Bacteroidales bacterium]